MMAGRKKVVPLPGTRKDTLPADGDPDAPRPRRNIQVKSLDDTSGLSWREERELKRALYASLQESRRQARMQQEQQRQQTDPVGEKNEISSSISREEPVSQSNNSNHSSSTATSSTVDENSQDSMKSSVGVAGTSSQEIKRTKIHAQRKFAQGSLPCTPSATPNKTKSSPLCLPKRAKTEDFLTFLCLRGSSVLPSHLDFFNYSCKDGTGGDNSRPQTPAGANYKQRIQTRESSPLSTATSTSSNEDVSEVVRGYQTPSRKAARASASTPETARGLAGMQQSLVRKVVTKLGAKLGLPKLAAPKPLPVPLRPTSCNSQITKTPNALSGLSLPSRKGASSFADVPRKRTMQKQRLGGQGSNVKNMKKKTSSLRDRRTLILRAATKSQTSSKSLINTRYLYHQNTKPVRASAMPTGKTFPPRSINPVVPLKKLSENVQVREKTAKGKKLLFNPIKSLKNRVAKKQKQILDKTSLEFLKPRSHKRVRSDKPCVEGLSEQEEDAVGTRKQPLRFSKRLSSYSKRVAIQEELEKSGVKTTSTNLTTKKKLSILRKMRRLKMPNREQLKLARIIEKRRGGKGTYLGDSKPAVLQEAEQLKDTSIPLRTGKRRGRPPVKKHLPADRVIKFEPFPVDDEPARIVDIPIFYPSEEEFQDPLVYIAEIKAQAEPYGMCKIVPPSGWKLESRVNEEMRFTNQVQYVHKMHNRWGPNVQHVECIRKHLASVDVELDQPPLIGGIEVDLSRLFHIIQDHGGMQKVIDKKKWMKVADALRIPKLAQDRTTKLYNAYCKYLLSYEMLSSEERNKLQQQVSEEKHDKCVHSSDEQYNEDCILKGKSTSVSAFLRVARNTLSMWFKDDPTPEQVETEYWKIVREGLSHVVVQCGHICSGNQGTLFPSKKESTYAKHAWNLNVLAKNPLSVLKHLGPVPGVTMSVLHIGMLFTTNCWSANQHFLPYIQYLHSGAELIWYSIPPQEEQKFKAAMQELVPKLVGLGENWLKDNTVMINPELLVEKGVSVGRIVQSQHQFVILFPQTYTSSVTCGYSMSESIHYATVDWIPHGYKAMEILNKSCQREQFSMERLLMTLARADGISQSILATTLQFLEEVIQKELLLRKQLHEAGLKMMKRMSTSEDVAPIPTKRKRILEIEEEENRCEVSKKICYNSMVVNENEDTVYCLEHALPHIQKKRNLRACKLFYRYSDDELREILKSAADRLQDLAETNPKRKTHKRLESKS